MSINPATNPPTLLITFSGTDRPGVTTTVFGTLSTYGVEVIDVEQIVVRGQLILGVLITAPREWHTLRSAMEGAGAELGMSVNVIKGSGSPRRCGSATVPATRSRRWPANTSSTADGDAS